jgi:hypothetical protein
VSGRAHPLPVLRHRQSSLGQRSVEYLAGLGAVAVLCTGARCRPRRHVGDRKRSVAVTAVRCRRDVST